MGELPSARVVGRVWLQIASRRQKYWQGFDVVMAQVTVESSRELKIVIGGAEHEVRLTTDTDQPLGRVIPRAEVALDSGLPGDLAVVAVLFGDAWLETARQ